MPVKVNSRSISYFDKIQLNTKREEISNKNGKMWTEQPPIQQYIYIQQTASSLHMIPLLLEYMADWIILVRSTRYQKIPHLLIIVWFRDPRYIMQPTNRSNNPLQIFPTRTARELFFRFFILFWLILWFSMLNGTFYVSSFLFFVFVTGAARQRISSTSIVVDVKKFVRQLAALKTDGQMVRLCKYGGHVGAPCGVFKIWSLKPHENWRMRRRWSAKTAGIQRMRIRDSN